MKRFSFSRTPAAATLRRGMLTGLLALPLAAGAVAFAAPPAAAQDAAAQQIANHFSSVQSMAGKFVQFNPDGGQTGGNFYIERPGKVRFDYTSSPLRVIADGSQVAVHNSELNTWDLYPLSETPMKLLLDRNIDLSAANIQSVEVNPDLTTIVMGDSSVFGNSRITMMFDTQTNELRQWTIRDSQGKDTTVMIHDVTAGVDIQNSAFEIPYTAIAQGQTGN